MPTLLARAFTAAIDQRHGKAMIGEPWLAQHLTLLTNQV
jgi:hypothetical protein